MKEISTGAQKWEGEKWFAELSDKRMYTCNPLFLSGKLIQLYCLLEKKLYQAGTMPISFIVLLGTVGLQQYKLTYFLPN